MNETEEYIANCIHVWAYGGFCTREDANEFLDDILEDDADEKKMRALIDHKFTEKEGAELNWPETTDCDLLDAAFQDLNDSGIIAIQNTGYTMSDGLGDVGEVHSQKPKGTYKGYCFFHGQDLERAIFHGNLMLAFGDMEDTNDGKESVANIILAKLKKHGIRAVWAGDPNKRIEIPEITWLRRYK